MIFLHFSEVIGRKCSVKCLLYVKRLKFMWTIWLNLTWGQDSRTMCEGSKFEKGLPLNWAPFLFTLHQIYFHFQYIFSIFPQVNYNPFHPYSMFHWRRITSERENIAQSLHISSNKSQIYERDNFKVTYRWLWKSLCSKTLYWKRSKFS